MVGIVGFMTPHFTKLIDRLEKMLSPYPRLRAVSVIGVGLLVVFLIGWVASGMMLAQQALWFLTVPWLLWAFLSRIDSDDSQIYYKASTRAAIIAALGFFLALFVSGFGQTVALAMGMAGGMFTFIDYQAFRRLVVRHVFAAAAAAAGAMSGILCYTLQLSIWKSVAGATASSVYFLLYYFVPRMMVFAKGHRPPPPSVPAPPGAPHAVVHRFHITTTKRIFVHGPAQPPAPPVRDTTPDFMALASDHFTLRIPQFDNATIGICLFLLVLSLELVLSGRQVMPKRLAAMVAGGAALIFISNALLMTLYFYLSDLALTPGAGGLTVNASHVLGFLLNQPVISMVGYALVSIGCVRLFLGKLTYCHFRRA